MFLRGQRALGKATKTKTKKGTIKMWGIMSHGNDGNKVWFKSVGYIGLVRTTSESGAVREEYICEAGNKGDHDKGIFDWQSSVESILNRGTFVLFDSKEDVRKAFSMIHSSAKRELVKIIKVTYTESSTFEETE